MNSALIDTTVGHLVDGDGSIVTRPGLLLSADAAGIIRAYFLWAMQNHLEPQLVCQSCDDHTRDSKIIYTIDEQQIVFVCQCAIRYFEGYTLPPPALAPSLSASVDVAGPAHMALSVDVARLLRQYKKVLLDTGLKEALHCNACFELGMADGCDASVTDSQIKIRCRCTNRTFVGSSL